MEKVIGVSVIDPCFFCCCYDPDFGCLMSSLDRCYAYPLEPQPTEKDFENNIEE